MRPSVDAIRACLEGVVPAPVATCSPDGTPNVTYVSQVHYVDRSHVALSFQFFNKTRENILANPHATVLVEHPRTAARYQLALLYRRTETEGPLFESMRAKLAGIASHSGMAGVFRLRGADVYQVLDVQHVPGDEVPDDREEPARLAALRAATERLAGVVDLAGLLDVALDTLSEDLGVEHAMILLADERAGRLFTVASRGYPQSGLGSELPWAQGLIGTAATCGAPVRISHVTHELSYSHAVREHLARSGGSDLLETEIPLPGLVSPASQLSVPIACGRRVLGVLHVESREIHRFSYDDEDTLTVFARILGGAIAHLGSAADAPGDAATSGATPAAVGLPIVVRHYAVNDSVFLGEDYLIKGVAGAILWRLLCIHEAEGRVDFTNRELRLDRSIGLPEVGDNLEARLILLSRRLAERGAPIRLEKTGRGRFRLVLSRPVLREEVPRGR